MTFIVSAQVLKPLFVLLLFVIPYTFVAFIWWFIYSAGVIWSDAGRACSDYNAIVNTNVTENRFDDEAALLLGI